MLLGHTAVKWQDRKRNPHSLTPELALANFVLFCLPPFAPLHSPCPGYGTIIYPGSEVEVLVFQNAF